MRAVSRRSSLASFVSFCLMIAAVSPLLAQSRRIDGGNVSQEKFGFYWETRLEPGTPPLAESFSTSTTYGPGVVHRLLVDSVQKVYVGYDVLIAPMSEPNTYRLTFQNLTLTREMARERFNDAWANIPTPGWGLPTPQIIHGGDVVALTLLKSKTTNQQVVDYVTVQEPSRRFSGFNPVPAREFTFASGTSRDFKVDDVELTIQSPRFSINGKLDESSSGRFDEVSGAIVWIYAPKRGRFSLSLVPHPELGFRKAGEVRGSSLSFVIGGDTFALSTGGRIAPGQAPFSLYVLHEPDWKPTYLHANLEVFNMGAR